MDTGLSNLSLVQLVNRNLELFYKQDWYYHELFANSKEVGEYSALYWVKRYLDGYEERLWNKYTWACDKDQNGDRVYVGNWGSGGFQIHRHLTIRPEMFINNAP